MPMAQRTPGFRGFFSPAACAMHIWEPEPKARADDKAISTLEVKASAGDDDPRRDDTAISQEELGKYGDTNVYDVLKRASA